MMINQLTYIVISVCSILVVSYEAQLKNLETLQSTKSANGVTVSGLSSGAYFAVQFHIAYSSIVNGSAVFAGWLLFPPLFPYMKKI